jgi:hypothetical protein
VLQPIYRIMTVRQQSRSSSIEPAPKDDYHGDDDRLCLLRIVQQAGGCVQGEVSFGCGARGAIPEQTGQHLKNSPTHRIFSLTNQNVFENEFPTGG